MNAEEYLSVLNENQFEAVVHTGSPLLILAGAGSGKTRVITTKIAYMISELGIEPYSILAVTFTKKAASEMLERATRLESMAAKSQIRTFHSFGSWFLRKHYVEANLDKNFTVYDDDDMEALVLKANPTLSRVQAKLVANKISLAKDYCLMPTDDLSKIDATPEFALQYKNYQERLEKTGNVDFGDLIMKCVIVLRENQEVKNHMHNLFKVVMVDEYQDSNVAQFELLRELVGEKTYVCVVGDDDQSIYKFRGAEVENILNFKEVFPGTQVIKLEENYRSVPCVLSLANSVIKNNKKRLGKELKSTRQAEKKGKLVFLSNQNDEVVYVTTLIKACYEKGIPYSDWAVLYRTNAQSRGFETCFLQNQIPYTVVGTVKFYQREEVKDALSYLAFISNMKDEISFSRILNKPVRGIGATSLQKILALYQQKVYEDSGYNYLDACRDFCASASAKQKKSLADFVSMVENLQKFLDNNGLENENTPVEELALNSAGFVKPKTEKAMLSDFIEKLLLGSGLIDFYKARDELGDTQKVDNLKEVSNLAVIYPLNRNGLTEFLDHIELDRSLELKDEEDENPDRVTLITIHNTKGLEFNRVIITGMEEGIFPRQDKVDEELEEERRLFYVGITRARNEIYFTSVGCRALYGRTSFLEPSKFLFELDRNFLEIEGKVPFAFRNAKNNGRAVTDKQARNDALSQKWSKGKKVFHDDYGYGYIINANNDGTEFVIMVQFENGQIKRFMPRYQANRITLVQD